LKKSIVNNFDLIRLFAALQVALAHMSINLDHSYSILKFLSLFPGVPIFFFLSGYLIYGSYESSFKNENIFLNFYTKRFFRIYPGLFVCLLFSIILVLISGYISIGDINFKDVFFWFVSQLTFFQFYNPDFLRGFGVGVLNGALWTISIELQFYILFPIVYRLMEQKKLIIFSIIFLFIILNISFNYFTRHYTDTILLKLFNVSFAPWFYMFLGGAFFAKFKEYISSILNINIFGLLLALIVTYLISNNLGLSYGNKLNPLSYILIVAIMIHVAFTYPNLSNLLLRKNDFSYGIYIYHMPIVNFILYNYGTGSAQYFVAFFGTISVALLSWFLIEKPSMKLKKNALRRN